MDKQNLKEIDTCVLIHLIRTIQENKCKIVDLIDTITKSNRLQSKFFNDDKETYTYQTLYLNCISSNYHILKEIENKTSTEEEEKRIYDFPKLDKVQIRR